VIHNSSISFGNRKSSRYRSQHGERTDNKGNFIMFDKQGRVVAVTGGASGIGAADAEVLARI
jgi:hypothetical protein